MDVSSFSQTYWYIWFLVALLLVLLFLINVVGLYIFQKRRNAFLTNTPTDDQNIPMNDRSTTNISQHRSYDQTGYVQFTNSSFVSNQSEIINNNQTMPELNSSQLGFVLKENQFNPQINRISYFSNVSKETTSQHEIDLSLEQFQRQALKEHNAMRATYKKSPLKLSESLNVYAQYWAEQCAQSNHAISSRPEWRSHYKGQPVGENIITLKSDYELDGNQFTALIMAKGNDSREVDCVLNEMTTEVGFGRALMKPTDDTEQLQKWIGVAHYYPHRQLPTVQS